MDDIESGRCPDNVRTAATETLADRRLFVLDDENWQAFLAALDSRPKPRPRLEKLLHEPGVFD